MCLANYQGMQYKHCTTFDEDFVLFDDTLAGDRRTPVSELGRMSLSPPGAMRGKIP
jgi:hypothetical protein